MKKLVVLVVLSSLVASGSAYALSRNYDLPFGQSPSASTFTGTRTSMTYAMTTFDQPFRLRGLGGGRSIQVNPTIDNPQEITRLDQMTLTCHGGVADIRWYVGDLEPTHPMTGITLTVELDGRPLGSLIKGGHDGTYDDGPASIETATYCRKGDHQLWIQIEQLNDDWGIPYAGKTGLVTRGFVVQETWG